jgi:stress-induced morphogen
MNELRERQVAVFEQLLEKSNAAHNDIIDLPYSHKLEPAAGGTHFAVSVWSTE